MDELKTLIYIQRTDLLLLIAGIGSLFWININRFIEEKENIWFVAKLNSLLLVLNSILIIYSYTLSGRSLVEAVDTLRLFPFYPIVFHEMYDEYFRTLFMNVLLFYPFGVGVSFSLPRKTKYRSILVTVLGFALSLYVEFLQYRYHLGIFETDDLICNTFGAFLGSMLFVIYRKGKLH